MIGAEVRDALRRLVGRRLRLTQLDGRVAQRDVRAERLKRALEIAVDPESGRAAERVG
ncbi:hypothetical protein FHX81_6979 [Saccharothrix saharensis]|uniref:Uncharacterized protein n=1 Tax=Saccharothrix saharensis TaxID=571190 RepID=A0A543JNX7_9PSEU|nr:hypothetical protein FHX81_6979 [Saccharothrix saharensis]